jgi:NarL family two-component system response regulator LiaR
MIVDDHAIVREGLTTILEAFPEFELAGEASDGKEAVDHFEELNPDVILMDLIMPNMDGVSATGKILERNPETLILALTSFIEDKMVQDALQAGAAGYLLKNISAQELADAINSIMVGKNVLAPEATKALIRSSLAPQAIGHDLTRRELEVLSLMVEGLTNAQIADQLYIQPATVKNHVSNIYSKLGSASRTEAVVLALKHNIIEDS